MKKLSLLAVAVSLVLTGCGGSGDSVDSGGSVDSVDSGDSGSSVDSVDSVDSGDSTPKTTTNQFIDAAVEGLYYKAMPSGSDGTTTSDGSYTAENDDTITFYLGGESGVKIGAASNNNVLTPFEAAGKYNRALHLAIIFQSLDNRFGASGDDVLSIPAKLQSISDPAVAAALADLNLDSLTSVEAFLAAVGVTSDLIATEEEAIDHMESSLAGVERGGDSTPVFLTRTGRIVKSIGIKQYSLATEVINSTTWAASYGTFQGHDYDYTYVHADNTALGAVFEETRGMESQYFRLNAGENITFLAGSDNWSLTEGWAETYLNCLDKSTVTFDENNNGAPSCGLNGNGSTSSQYNIMGSGDTFAYVLRHPDTDKAITSADQSIPYTNAYIKNPFNAKSEADLNHYSINYTNDAEDGKKKNITSGTYDSTTEIYTQIKKQYSYGTCDIENDDSCKAQRTTVGLTYYYQVDSISSERYVDFTGTWEETQICDDSQTATRTYVFNDSGLTTSGTECSGTGTGTTPTLISGVYTYEQLSGIDYWWFNNTDSSTGRTASQATLTELNSVVRFCDEDGYVQGDACPVNKEYFIKRVYQPAGVDLDEGLLTRIKMSSDGSVESFSTMQKVK
jgi:hypothetical protein